MRKYLNYAGGLLLVGVAGALLLVAYAGWVGPTLNQESRQVVDQVLPVLLRDLRLETLAPHALPELMAELRAKDAARGFAAVAAAVGEFTAYQGSQGQADTLLDTRWGHWGLLQAARYQASAQHAKGMLWVKLELSKRAGRWLIASFWVSTTPPKGDAPH